MVSVRDSRRHVLLPRNVRVLLTALWFAAAWATWGGQSVSLGWNPSPDTNAVGYALYSGPASGTYTNRIDAGANTTCTASNLVEGATYYFVVTAYDIDGLESIPSNEVVYTVPTNSPLPQLIITAQPAAKVYGAPLPELTVAYSGFIDGDTPASLSAPPTLTTTAGGFSPVGVYPIRASGAVSGKYAIQYVDGALTITPAFTTGAIASSVSPSLPGQQVVFTFSAAVVAPGVGTPTGVVQFNIDGVPAGLPVALVAGTATLASASLGSGTHAVAAAYAGDGNFLGVTNILSPAQVVNTAPVALTDWIERDPTSTVKVSVTTLLANDYDPDGQAVTFAGFSAQTANGGKVTKTGNWLTYTPAAGYTNADSFTYSISDGYASPVTGRVNVRIRGDLGPSPNLAIAPTSTGSWLIRGDGIPGRTYRIQYATAPQGGAWLTLGSATANAASVFVLEDPAASGQRFYRSVYP